MVRKFQDWAEALIYGYERQGCRLLLKKLLAKRVGELPAMWVERIDSAEIEDIEAWHERLMDGQTPENVFAAA